MADNQAGIMALQQQAQQPPMQTLPVDQTYGLMKKAADTVAPGMQADLEALFAKMAPIISKLSDDQLDKLIKLFKALHDSPEQYASAVAQLVQKGVFKQDTLPAEYNPEFLATMIAAFLEEKRRRAQAPQQQFAKGGLADAARAVAAAGRNGDTMLAHINKTEAGILKGLGGSGTINPKTGLPEFSFWEELKKPFKAAEDAVSDLGSSVSDAVSDLGSSVSDAVSDLGSSVSDAVSDLGTSVKDALNSPVGQIVGTVALASMGVPLPLASGATTLLGGGSLKDAVLNAGIAYLGGPSGPLAGMTSGISNPLLAAGARGMISGTAAGLLRGQNLQEAVRGGLTQAAIQGTSSYVQGMTEPTIAPVGSVEGTGVPAQPGGVPTAGAQGAVPPDAVAAAEAQRIPASDLYSAAGKEAVATQLGANISTAPPVMLSDELGNRVAEYRALTPDQIDTADFGDWATGGDQPMGAPVDSQGNYYTDELGKRVAVQPSNGILDTVKQGAQDAWAGVKNLYNEYLSPSGIKAAGAEEAATKAEEAVQNALLKNPNASPEYLALIRKTAFEAAMPGLLATYGPMAAAGLGITALAGGFEPTPAPQPTIGLSATGKTGMDLLKESPSSYLPKVPGMLYDANGKIIGFSARTPYTMEDIRRTSTADYGKQGGFTPYQAITPRRFAAQGSPITGEQGIASLMKGGYPRRTGQISGPGTETSDDIPAMLSDGEFVMTAKAVRGAGNGSRRAGAKRMYALMHQLERNAERG